IFLALPLFKLSRSSRDNSRAGTARSNLRASESQWALAVGESAILRSSLPLSLNSCASEGLHRSSFRQWEAMAEPHPKVRRISSKPTELRLQVRACPSQPAWKR